MKNIMAVFIIMPMCLTMSIVSACSETKKQYDYIPEECYHALLDKDLLNVVGEQASNLSTGLIDMHYWCEVIAGVENNDFSSFLSNILIQLHDNDCIPLENDLISCYMGFRGDSDIVQVENMFSLGYDEDGYYNEDAPSSSNHNTYYTRGILIQTINNNWYLYEGHGFENEPNSEAGFVVFDDYYKEEMGLQDTFNLNGYEFKKLDPYKYYTNGELALAFRAGNIVYEYFEEVYNPHIEMKNDAVEKKRQEENFKIEPVIGMTKEEVIKSSWGSPDEKNITETQYGVHEQWVYGNGNYLYFDDGYVTAIQKRD